MRDVTYVACDECVTYVTCVCLVTHRYRIPARTGSTPDSSTSNLGFRCVQPLAEDEAVPEEERC
jgi:hypothetical protein